MFLHIKVDIIQRDKISERAVFLPQAPQILVQTLPLQALSSIPLSPPSPPSPPSTLSPSTSTDSSISSAQLGVASPEEGVEYKLVAMPVRMKGWFVVHFLDHDVTKISKVEAHYYTPLEVT
ncbi:hypothetical protein EON65_31670 [archaeon]|nr:MAG: hypothetical protein EON65_31670 [archaeon]